MSITADRSALLKAGFKPNEIKSAFQTRKQIREACPIMGRKDSLVTHATYTAHQQTWQENPRRGLWFTLWEIVGSQDPRKLIMDAIDPSWPLLPSPDELQDDSGYDEIDGHLTLIRISLEAWKTVFSSDKESLSNFLIFTEPFSHTVDTEKYNTKDDDMFKFKTFSGFWKKTGITHHKGTPSDRFGFFVTKTKSWVQVPREQYSDFPQHAWIAWLSKVPGNTFQLLIFDPNYTGTPGSEVYKTKLLSSQKKLIQGCLNAWKTLLPEQLYLVCNPAGNPDGKCLQLCSQWLQDTLKNENWRQFPLSIQQVLTIASPIIWSEAGHRSSTNTSRNTSPGSPPATRSRSRSRTSSLAPKSRPASPSLQLPTRKRSRLNIASIMNPVGDTTGDTADGEHELVSDNDMIAQQLGQSGIDMENIDLTMPRMEPSEMLLPNRSPVPVSDEPVTEEEVTMVPIDPIEGLSSAINLAPTPTAGPIHSSQLRTLPEITPIPSPSVLDAPTPRAFNSSQLRTLPEITPIPSPIPSPSILDAPTPRAFNSSATGHSNIPQSPSPDTSRNQFNIEEHMRERDEKLAAERERKRLEKEEKRAARRAIKGKDAA
jgi:hypothetical protein